ncbi:mutS protein homolog 5-like [Brevipalpus obovatus]|uniref:mutS protein homolog 5-like n=1 Tax=Brevipalpus obovatus TaxID=246614 RepID=UPI003D9EAC95
MSVFPNIFSSDLLLPNRSLDEWPSEDLLGTCDDADDEILPSTTNHHHKDDVDDDETDKFVRVDELSKRALQVFANDTHPSVYKQGSSSKEGCSLYAIFCRCVSPIGRRELRKIIDKPIRDVEELNNRLDIVEFFMRRSRDESYSIFKDHLKKIFHPQPILSRIDVTELKPRDWFRLTDLLRDLISIGNIFRVWNVALPLVQQYLTLLDENELKYAKNLIEDTMDFAKTKENSVFSVKQGFDPKVDQLNEIIDDLPAVLHRASLMEQAKYKDWVDRCEVCYVRLLGFHVQVPLSDEMVMIGHFRLPGLEFKYRIGMTGHYKSPLTVELDSKYDDIQVKVVNLQLKIQYALQGAISKRISFLPALVDLCAKFSSFIAIAETSSTFNYRRPIFTLDNVIEIKNGRHPLQEFFVKEFVPNDCASGMNNENITIITGPNACGKSIYLKQICLIAYMAHIGSFVPADFLRIGPLDSIFTRIKAIDSVSNNTSTFLSDVIQIAKICREYTSRSLIAIDEFGKSTDPRSGPSLLASLVDFFTGKSHKKPHTFISTHFLSIGDHIEKEQLVSFKTFKVDARDDGIIYNYKLIDGKSTKSRGILLARVVGLSQQFVARATQIENALRSRVIVEPCYIPESVRKTQKLIGIAEMFEKIDLNGVNLADFFRTIKEF